jgi:LPS sulfotransferase NodH
MSPISNYAVCASPRTGSSLLCELLSGTGVAGAPVEYFQEGFHRRGWYLQLNCTDFDDYRSKLLRQRITPNGVFGFKTHWSQFSHLMTLLTGMSGASPQAFTHWRQSLDDTLGCRRFIYVTRQDIVQQAVSLVVARHTGVWYDHGQSIGKLNDTPFDVEAIDRAVDYIRESRTMWRTFFDQSGVDALLVRYEELVSDREGTLSRVLDYLGLELPAPIDTSAVVRLRRQANEGSEALVSLYRQTCAERGRSEIDDVRL